MIRTRPIQLLVAAGRAGERRNLPRKLPLVLATLAGACAVAALPASASATTSALKPEALTRARAIRAEINARSRLLPGAGSSSPRRRARASWSASRS